MRLRFSFAVFVLLLVIAAPAQASLYTNSAPIAVPGCALGDCSNGGQADPFPSTINVGGLGSVARVRVTLRGISHSVPDDIDAVLVGPGGQKEMLMSDACAGAALTGQTLMFEDGHSPLPQTGPCTPGVYRPTDYPPADSFGPNGPAPPYNTSLSEFAGGSADGPWHLYVFDDGFTMGNGTIGGGWRLELLPKVTCAGKTPTEYESVGTEGNDFITGTPGNDVLVGLGGNDTIDGEGGNDVICGGPGNDKLLGGPGKDLLLGQGGRDSLKGQGGKDTCVGGKGPDKAKSCEKEKSI